MKRFPFLLLLLLPLATTCESPGAIPGLSASEAIVEHVHVPAVPLRRILDSLAVPDDSVHLRVEKAGRVFHVIVMGKVLKSYPCVLGMVPEGDKQMQGDRRTPEGIFTFRDKYPHREWHKFVWVDYPNAESRRRFQERKRKGVIPADAQIGGEIGIHGVPAGMDHWIVQGSDWTWGCIALRNADLDEVFPLIKPSHTTITILP